MLLTRKFSSQHVQLTSPPPPTKKVSLMEKQFIQKQKGLALISNLSVRKALYNMYIYYIGIWINKIEKNIFRFP